MTALHAIDTVGIAAMVTDQPSEAIVATWPSRLKTTIVSYGQLPASEPGRWHD